MTLSSNLSIMIQCSNKPSDPDKRYDFTFSIVNFPFISSNIPASPAYGVYISQLIRYSRACVHYSDLTGQSSAADSKLLKQDYVAPRLKSSLQSFYSRLVDRYEIFYISNDNGSFIFT